MKPCGRCGGPVRVETFNVGLLYICSNSRIFGGWCMNNAFLSAKDWEGQGVTELVIDTDPMLPGM